MNNNADIAQGVPMLNKSLLITLLASAISSTAFATSKEAPDRDLDDDGLIEINNWADLNEIRNNTSGKLYGSNLGCPTAGCTGYELTADLDFDTNGNGKFDANDAYWNNGDGWIPLNIDNAEIEGNGHLIRNLIVNNKVPFGGLFGSVKNLHIRNLGLTGKLMSIEAGLSTDALSGLAGEHSGLAGGFAGLMEGGSITGCFSTGRVITEGFRAGGLVGVSHGTAFKAVFSSALIERAIFGAGLVGLADVDSNGTPSTVDSSYAVGKTPVIQRYRGLVNGGGPITNSYYAVDAKGDSSIIDPPYYEEIDRTLFDLKYGASDYSFKASTCLEATNCPVHKLYVGWADVKDAKGNAYWDFGTTEQLPGLVLNGTLYRDSDGNGVLDSDEPTGSSSSSSTSSLNASSSSSSSASSLAGNVAPIIKIKNYWAKEVWDDFSRLDASETVDPNGDTLSFTWFFHDGKTASTANGAVVPHPYYAVGEFLAILTVDDGHGGVSTMQWKVKIADTHASSSKSSPNISSSLSSAVSSSSVASASVLASSVSAVSSATNSSFASSVAVASSNASASNSSAAPVTAAAAAAAKDSGGGSVNFLMLVLLSGLGLAWRGKKAA